MKKLLISGLILSGFTFVPAFVPVFQSSPMSTVQAAEKRLRLAIVPFENITRRESDAWLSDSFAESLTMGLAKVKSLKLIERTQMKKVIQEQHFGQSLFVDAESAPELGQMLGAEVMLIGSFQKVGRSIQINARVVNVASGEVSQDQVTQVEGDFDNLFALQKQLMRQLLPTLRVSASEPEVQRAARRLSGTQSVKAYGDYHKGLQDLRVATPEMLARAKAHFEKALDTSPDYALARLGLVETLLSQAEYYQALLVKPDNTPVPDVLLQQAEEQLNTVFEQARDLPQTYRAAARLMLAKNRKSDALELLKQALAMNPDDADTVNAYFDAQFKSLNYSLDVEAVNAELESLGADISDPYYRLRVANYLMTVGADIDPKLLEQSRQMFLGLHKSLPGLYEVPYSLAYIATVQKRKTAALKWAKLAYQVSHKGPESLSALASIAHSNGFTEQAEQWLAEGEQKAPGNRYTLLQRAHILWQQNKGAEAEALYQQVDKKMNYHPLVPFTLGSVYMQKDDYPTALSWFEESLKRVEKYPEFGYGRAATMVMMNHYFLGNMERAATFAKTLREDPENYEMAYRILALSHSLKKEYQQALEAYQALFQIHPELKKDANLWSWYRRSYLEVTLKKDPDNVAALLDMASVVISQTLPLKVPKQRDTGFRVAEGYLSRAYLIAPDNYQVNHALGYLELERGNFPQAIEYLKATVLIKADYKKGWHNLGLAYAKNGQPAQAKTAWQKVLALDPTDTRAKQALSSIAIQN